jgi:hypothetical protein
VLGGDPEGLGRVLIFLATVKSKGPDKDKPLMLHRGVHRLVIELCHILARDGWMYSTLLAPLRCLTGTNVPHSLFVFSFSVAVLLRVGDPSQHHQRGFHSKGILPIQFH